MGLCSDCRSEGETITYVGGSKDEVLDQGEEESEEMDPSTDDEPESGDLLECDLCGTEYAPDEE